jgi:ornithine carbamoyltransferase
MTELKGKDFISLKDFSREELLHILDAARELKGTSEPGAQVDMLKGRTLAMIFERPSTRTRVSMESAMTQLGGHAQYLDIKTMHYGGGVQPGVASMPAGGEPLADTYRVLATYANGIYHRTTYAKGSHIAMVEGASLIDVPVINACDDYEHPCQILANLLTIREKKKKFERFEVVILWLPPRVPLVSVECAEAWNGYDNSHPGRM